VILSAQDCPGCRKHVRNEKKKFCGVCSAYGDEVPNFMALVVCVNVVSFLMDFLLYFTR